MVITRRAAIATCLAPLAVRAQTFPDQPVRLLVPFPPGGPADAIARLLEPGMRGVLGRPLVIENRSGAGGVLGVEAVARARPDGHTIGLGSSGALVILPHLNPRMPYDALKDLLPIGQVLAVPQLLVVAPGVPATSVAELVALAKARPGDLAYGSAGIGSSLHLAAEMFRQRAGIDVTHVPYRGAAPAITDILGGRIQFMLADVPVLLPQVRGGALRALAITSPERSTLLPELPTMAEAGVPGVVSETLYGLLAPAGVVPERIAVLHEALAAALNDPETRRRLDEQGGRVVGSTPAQFAAQLRTEHEAWGAIVRAGNIKLE